MFFLDHIWVIPLLPIFSAAVMFFFGRKLDKKAVNAFCVGAVVVAFAWSCLAVWQYTQTWQPAHNNGPYQTILYTWLGTGDAQHGITLPGAHGPFQFNADAGFLLDPLSAIWLLFVTGVGMLIHIYSIGYMAHEGGYYRFFGYLNLFMFSMLTLVLGNNYTMMFVGWEGVGLCSYLLIGFWFKKHSASTAANKAFIVNRIGDAGFLMGMMTIAWYFGSVRFTDITHTLHTSHFAVGDPVITFATLMLFIGACGKSAQLPLYVWLPDAMEGPTPVSALIHAATMVTAGVYMVARSNALFIAGADQHEDRGHHRRADGDLRRLDRPGAERHQARARLLHRLAARIHVPGAGRGRVCRRRVPRVHARLLQGAAVPRLRLGDPRHERRAGHAQHGRPVEAHSDHLQNHAHRNAGHRRHSAAGGLLLERTKFCGRRTRRTTAASACCGDVGFAAALMTAFYMFRLIYLTFWSPAG